MTKETDDPPTISRILEDENGRVCSVQFDPMQGAILLEDYCYRHCWIDMDAVPWLVEQLQAPAPGWRPIETAPVGREVIGGFQYPAERTRGRMFVHSHDGVTWFDSRGVEVKPQFWMPAPPTNFTPEDGDPSAGRIPAGTQ